MSHQDNINLVRETLVELYSRKNGCPDPTCGVCSRLRDEYASALAALSALEKIPAPVFVCGRCTQLRDGVQGEEIPEHSPRCPMREERARAWDEGYACAVNHRGVTLHGIDPNPHR